MKLDIGAGGLGVSSGTEQKGDINFDIYPYSGIDVVGDARYLPFKDESFDEISSWHLLEHFWEDEIPTVLQEWIRVLKYNGIFEIKVPNIKSVPIFVNFYLDLMGLGLIYGDKTGQRLEMLHKICFSSHSLEKYLRDANIVVIKYEPFYEIEDSWYNIFCNQVTKKYPLLSREIHFWGIKTEKAKKYKWLCKEDNYLEGVDMFIELTKNRSNT